MNALERRLVNDYQRGFPMASQPFAVLGEDLGVTEARVLTALEDLMARGAVSRVGPVFRPHTVGASTLAAMAVPQERLVDVADLVSGFPQVNHNYEREHRLNLWFVLTAPDQDEVRRTLADIEQRSGVPVLPLPMLEDYHIDLGFPLEGGDTVTRAVNGSGAPRRTAVSVPDPCVERVIPAIQGGLPLVSRPYARVAEQVGLDEATVRACIERLQESGAIRRFGIVVRHHEFGYRANAMVVWDVPDEGVSAIGGLAARAPFVTLCYRRARHLPEWPYNLYCMIHGRDREAVLGRVASLTSRCALDGRPSQVLFSGRRFKQRGALYRTGT